MCSGPNWFLFSVGLVIYFLTNIILYFLLGDFSGAEKIVDSKSMDLLLGLVIAPIFESLFIQLIPIEASKLICNRLLIPKYISIFLSGILFSLCHLYSFQYFLMTLVCGFYMALYYYIISVRSSSFEGFCWLVLLHFSCNLTAILCEQIL